MNGRVVLRGGTVVDGSGGALRTVDVAVDGDQIVEVGVVPARADDHVVDCSGRYLLPGLIDAHTHADGRVFDPDVAAALLSQGVTTVIAGQDGVSYAPGDGRYGSEYFAAINGPHPTYKGGGVAALLESYDGTTPVNVGYLVPHGTVRHEVMGYSSRTATDDELRQIAGLARVGLEEGALGVSTGLDYAPGYFADTAELIEFCRPAAEVGAIYVSHMRGGYEGNSPTGVEEVCAISRTTGVSSHISHFHAPASLVASLVDDACASGIDLSYDAYPYRRGCSLLAMPMLPPELLKLGTVEAARHLRDPAIRAKVLREWIPVMEKRPDIGLDWARGITMAYVSAEEYKWAEGLSLEKAASSVREHPAEFGMKMMAASDLAVSIVFMVPNQRPLEDIGALLTHRCHVGSSDGIYIGGHPHPRAWGSFARFLGLYARERSDYTWAQTAVHLSARTAARHCLGDRGRIEPGFAADIVVLDPALISDNATYEDPKVPATGVCDVLVNGAVVFHEGELTGVNSGRGLRRTSKVVKVSDR